KRRRWCSRTTAARRRCRTCSSPGARSAPTRRGSRAGRPTAAASTGSAASSWRRRPVVSSEPGLAIPSRVASASRQVSRLDEAESIAFFGLTGFERVLKTTVSLCPECLAHVPAIVFTRGGRVLVAKSCAAHGRSEAVLENDERFYFLSNKDRSGRRFADDRVMTIPEYGGCCGPGSSGCGPAVETGFGPYTGQTANKTCTLLVEITNACNLACPVCYSDARGDRKMPRADFQRYIDRLLETKGGLDSVQL